MVSAGNVYVTGGTYGRISDWDLVVLAFDPSGVLLWERVHSEAGWARALAPDAPGRAFVVGSGKPITGVARPRSR